VRIKEAPVTDFCRKGHFVAEERLFRETTQKPSSGKEGTSEVGNKEGQVRSRKCDAWYREGVASGEGEIGRGGLTLVTLEYWNSV